MITMHGCSWQLRCMALLRTTPAWFSSNSQLWINPQISFIPLERLIALNSFIITLPGALCVFLCNLWLVFHCSSEKLWILTLRTCHGSSWLAPWSELVLYISHRGLQKGNSQWWVLFFHFSFLRGHPHLTFRFYSWNILVREVRSISFQLRSSQSCFLFCIQTLTPAPGSVPSGLWKYQSGPPSTALECCSGCVSTIALKGQTHLNTHFYISSLILFVLEILQPHFISVQVNHNFSSGPWWFEWMQQKSVCVCVCCPVAHCGSH